MSVWSAGRHQDDPRSHLLVLWQAPPTRARLPTPPSPLRSSLGDETLPHALDVAERRTVVVLVHLLTTLCRTVRDGLLGVAVRQAVQRFVAIHAQLPQVGLQLVDLPLDVRDRFVAVVHDLLVGRACL